MIIHSGIYIQNECIIINIEGCNILLFVQTVILSPIADV